jgi:hypothetical protein
MLSRRCALRKPRPAKTPAGFGVAADAIQLHEDPMDYPNA